MAVVALISCSTTQAVRGSKDGYTTAVVHALADGGMPNICIAPLP